MSNPDKAYFVYMKDPHFDLSGPSSRKGEGSYLEEIYNLWDQTAEICKKVGAEALLVGGDVFLKVRPYQIPYTLITSMMRYFSKFPVPICGIIGNHDAQMGLSHYETYPIAVLIKSGLYRYLDENPLIVEKGDLKVKVGGVSYQKGAFEKVRDYKKGVEDYLILIAHFFMDKTAGMFFNEEIYGYNQFPDSDFDVLAVGHEHVNKGIHERDGKTFINSGQVTRVAADESNRNLKPSIVVFSVSKEGIKAKEVELKHKPADEIFGEVRDVKWREDKVDWEDFVADMSNIFSTHAAVDLTSMIQDSSYPNDVKERAISYVVGE
jgi:DNA repair exonuclease SbcCD nuclease subunit